MADPLGGFLADFGIIVLVIMILPYLLVLIALWRMGTGLLMIGRAVRARGMVPDLAESVARLVSVELDKAGALTRLANAQADTASAYKDISGKRGGQAG